MGRYWTMGRIQKCGQGTELIKKALVIGFGSIGQRHSKILSNLLGKKNIVVYSSQKKIPFKKLPSLEKIYDYDPDYIVVASPTSQHFDHIKQIESQSKGKTVLIEKPLFSEKRKITLKKNKYFVGYNLRFHPLINLLKKKIVKKRIFSINILCNSYLPQWRKNISYDKSSSAKKITGGGVLLDLSHEIDYLRYLVGDIFHSYSKNLKLSDLKIETDDCLYLFGEIKRGGLYSIHLNYFSRNPIRQILVETSKESIELDLHRAKMTIYYPKGKKEVIRERKSSDYSYEEQHKSLIKKDYSKVCKLDEAVKVMDIINNVQTLS